ncbi:MAG TPA: energy transducer TonB [Pyrinomonadaceae bacterium]|nr:energy transducer TonB [Pyrinomonadaceae bacterium]
MKKQLSLLACLAFTAVTAMAQPQIASPVVQTRQAELQTWKRYTVDGERFSVSLPTAPAMTTRDLTIWDLRRTRRERSIGAYADGAVYTIDVFENIPKKSLDDFIHERNRRNRWDPSTETPVTINDLKGKQYSSVGKPVNDTAQFFAAEGRLYEFSVVGNTADDEGAKQFFSSIVIGKKADGIDIHDGEGSPFSSPECDQIASGGKEVDRRVRVVMKPEPRYNELARQKRTVGTVIVRAVFSCNGSVGDVRVLEGLPNGLTDQAIAALRKLKFVPAVKNGKYVSMWMQLEYNFNLY